MILKDLTDTQIDWVYNTWMVQDFPEDERKPLAMIKKALRGGMYRCIGIFNGEALSGYAFFALVSYQGEQVLLDYFAVAPEQRNHGIGGAFLKRLPELFRQADAVYIETETAADTSDPAEQALRERRKAFYLRNGCNDSGVQALVFGVRFQLLYYPILANPTSEQVKNSYCSVYQKLLPPAMFQDNIAIAKS